MPQAARPEQHIAAAKARLAHTAGLAAKTHATEQRILEAAESRLEEVRADLDKLRHRVHLDPRAADRYRELTLESGQLATVIARARAAGA